MRLFQVVALLCAVSAPALAQDAENYTLEKTEDGYVRLDTRTGEMSICQERSGQLVCKMAADQRNAFEDELATLTARIEVLEDKVGKGSIGLPSEEDLDRTFGVMESFFRRFMGIMRDLNDDPRHRDLEKNRS